MLDVPSDRIRTYIREAETLTLLDRMTAFRAGMRAEVLPLVELELRRRGVDDVRIAAHQADVDATVVWESPGLARRCRYCERPATATAWDWLRLWETVPVFPMRSYFCAEHAPIHD